MEWRRWPYLCREGGVYGEHVVWCEEVSMVEGLLVHPVCFVWSCTKVDAECVFCIVRVVVVLGVEDGSGMMKSRVVRFRVNGRGVGGYGKEMMWKVV